jgi:hypothetical protein
MPMNTMLLSRRSSLSDGHSARSSLAICTWATISAAVRLRTRAWVPVWQKVQFSVQPTWLETHRAPDPADVGNVDGLDLDARGHADQPLAGAVLGHLALDDFRAGDREGLGQARAGVLGDVGHQGEVGDAAMVDPAEDLGGPHLGLAVLGHAGLDQGGHQLGAGQARQVDQRLCDGCGGRAVGGDARQIEGDAQGAVRGREELRGRGRHIALGGGFSKNAVEDPLRPSGPPPPKGEDLVSRCSPFGGAVAERLRGSSPTCPL